MPVPAAITIITATMTTISIMDDEPDVRVEFVDRLPLDLTPADSDQTAPSSSEAASRLLTWLSPSFPVGSFAFSHGLEWAVNAGHIRDARTTISWLETLIEHGALRNDTIFVACAWRVAHAGHSDTLREINELAIAMAGSRERHLETTAQGNAFVAIVREAWLNQPLERMLASVEGDIAYPIAVATTSAAHGVSLPDTLRFYALALVQNLVSATIRLSAIGHTDGQRAIAALQPALQNLSTFAISATLDDLGVAAFQSDIASMRHETQYSRLFRS
jgi:urease accessory protein